MDIKYFSDTDTLLLTFSDNLVVSTEDLNENMLVDLDESGNPVAMTIEHAKTFTNVMNFSYQQIVKPLQRLEYENQVF